MTSHDLNRAFEAFAPTAEQEQAMLDRLLTEQKEVRPVNRIKKMTVVLVAAALMLMACAFTVVTGLDQRILSYFGGGEEQAQLVSGGVVEVEKSFRYENGWASPRRGACWTGRTTPSGWGWRWTLRRRARREWQAGATAQSSWNREMGRTIGSPSCAPEGPSRPKARA